MSEERTMELVWKRKSHFIYGVYSLAYTPTIEGIIHSNEKQRYTITKRERNRFNRKIQGTSKSKMEKRIS